MEPLQAGTVGTPAVFTNDGALAAPTMKRKMPLRASEVDTVRVWVRLCCTRCDCQLKKKKILFLRMGPPSEAPYWLRMRTSRGSPPRLLNQSLALYAVLRLYSKRLPWNWLVPERVTTCTCAPEFRPYSALATLVITRYSPIESGFMPTCESSPRGITGSLTSTPSSVVYTPRPRSPFTENVTV